MTSLSIITVNYNNAQGLERTIDSVVKQTFTDMEFIVVDGGSSDESQEVIRTNEAHITKWISEKDNGVYHAMNKAIDLATGEYILFLNSGDHFAHHEVLQKNKQHFGQTDLLIFDIHVTGQGLDYIKQHPDDITFSYLFKDTLAHQAVFIKRSLFEKWGAYDESLKIVSDWKFFLKALYHGATYKIVHEVLTKYYLDGMSATAQGTFTRREERERILKDEYPMFYSDYKKLQILDSNRFKMLADLEHSKVARKLNGIWLRILLRLFRSKSLKNLP
jgi:glycosyltransferase involved in cell wall biosynthesis